MAKVFLLLLITLTPSLVFAQGIFINEIAWMGSSVQNVDSNQWWRYEWIELHNSLDVPVGLDGWAIELSRDKPEFKISLKGSIDPNGYFLIGASDKIPNLDLYYLNLGGKFVNSGQRVVLKNSTGEVIDEVDATKGWPAGANKTKQTMERIAGSDPTMLWQTSANASGTPKAQNSQGFQAFLAKESAWKYPGDSSYIPTLSRETKKDLRGSSRPAEAGRGSPSAAFLIAVPGAVLAGALALAARRFLLRQV